MPAPKPVTAQTDRPTRIKAVFRVATGNFVEMYDFTVFGYYAAAIGRTFFPPAQRICRADALIRHLRSRLPDPAARRPGVRRLYRAARPPGGPDPHVRVDGNRDAFDRLRSRLCDHWPGRSAAGGGRTPAARLLG